MNEKNVEQLGALIEVMGPDDLGLLGKETLAVVGEVFNRLQKKKLEKPTGRRALVEHTKRKEDVEN